MQVKISCMLPLKNLKKQEHRRQKGFKGATVVKYEKKKKETAWL